MIPSAYWGYCSAVSAALANERVSSFWTLSEIVVRLSGDAAIAALAAEA